MHRVTHSENIKILRGSIRRPRVQGLTRLERLPPVVFLDFLRLGHQVYVGMFASGGLVRICLNLFDV